MRRYITISAGRRAEEAIPVLSTSDAEVIDAALRVINRRLQRQPEERPPDRIRYFGDVCLCDADVTTLRAVADAEKPSKAGMFLLHLADNIDAILADR